MATQNDRSIVGAVQQRDASGKIKMFVSGQEDELNACLPASQIERLTAKGVITGEWTGVEAVEESESKDDEPKAERPAKRARRA